MLKEVVLAKYFSPLFPDDEMTCVVNDGGATSGEHTIKAVITKNTVKIAELKLRVVLSDQKHREMRARKQKNYFERIPGAPDPLVVEVKRRVHFNEADPMAIAWHGRYPLFFEEASEELGRTLRPVLRGFFEAGLRAPLVESPYRLF